MADKHAVIRTDLLSGTYDGAKLRSFRYMGSGETATEIDNGNVVKLDGLIDGEREIWKGVTPETNTPLKDIVLVAGVEVMYDERKKNLDEYVNEAGKAVRGYILCTGDIFSVTAEALDGSPEKGKFLTLQAGTKMKVADQASEEDTNIGAIIAVDVVGRHTYYVVRVA